MGDGRRERGRLLSKDERIKHIDGPLWFVPSSTSGGYIVDAVASTCTCPDAQRGKCKHVFAIEIRRAAVPAPPPVPVAPKPMKLGLRDDLTAEEQRHARAALRFLRMRLGWEGLAKATRFTVKSLQHIAYGRAVGASLAVRLARAAEVPVDDLIGGRWPPAGVCVHCGRGP